MALKLKQNVNIVKRSEGSLVYSNEVGTLFKLEGVGAFIIDLIKNKQYTDKELLSKLEKEFPKVSKKMLENDLNEFLNQLKKECLLE
jgi:hypothetical protein